MGTLSVAGNNFFRPSSKRKQSLAFAEGEYEE